MAEIGLRERKRAQTRQLIFEAARRLFAERGFDAVSVAEIARAADFSEMTVFNHFPTKEDLVFSGMASFEDRLLDAVRNRPAGEAVVTAFGRAVLAGMDHLAGAETMSAIGAAASLIAGSRSLQNREREVAARHTKALAELLASDMGRTAEDLEAVTVANALMGVHVALLAYVRRAVAAGMSGGELAASARLQAKTAFSRLETGLADYGIRRSQPRRRLSRLSRLTAATATAEVVE